MTLVCRREVPTDFSSIHEVESAAFGRASEAVLVDALRAAGGLSISAVAEEDGRVVGHIAFSPVSIENSRESFPALALAPMAVHPEWQRQGIGSALVRWSLDECRREGHQLVIVLGHAEYYPRFGFVPARPLGILCPFDVPDEVFRLLELQPGALGARTGKVSYRPEFLQV
jgi:putative acetyltransferase